MRNFFSINSFIFIFHALNEVIGPHFKDHVSLAITIIIIIVKSTARISILHVKAYDKMLINECGVLGRV